MDEKCPLAPVYSQPVIEIHTFPILLFLFCFLLQDQSESAGMLSPRDNVVSPSPVMVQRIERAYYYDPEHMGVRSGSCETPVNVYRSTSGVTVVSGNGNRPLAEAVAALLGVPVHGTAVSQYSSGEISVRIGTAVLGHDVYIVQSTSGNALVDLNTALLELLLLIRKMKLANARRVTAIIPFYAYARQDRKTALRVPISASAVAEMIGRMGVDRVVSLELHAGQIQGFFGNVPVENLQVCYEFAKYLMSQPNFDPSRMVMVSPDAGGVERAKVLADILKVGRVVTIVKRRIKAGQVDCMQTVGDVAGFECVIVDDMCDTGGTLVKACELLKEMGAASVTACCAHGILTNPCAERVNACSALQELVVTDSIPQEENVVNIPKLRVLTVAPLLAAAIRKMADEESLSTLFKDKRACAAA